MNITAENILSKYDEKVFALGIELRSFLLSAMKGCMEMPDVSANVIGYGYGSGYKDTICAIIPSKKGIKLGLYKGSGLNDPAKLLAGSGKVHKYVEIKSTADIRSKAFKELLKQALAAYKARSGKQKTADKRH